MERDSSAQHYLPYQYYSTEMDVNFRVRIIAKKPIRIFFLEKFCFLPSPRFLILPNFSHPAPEIYERETAMEGRAYNNF